MLYQGSARVTLNGGKNIPTCILDDSTFNPELTQDHQKGRERLVAHA